MNPGRSALMSAMALWLLGGSCGPGVEDPDVLCRAVRCDTPPANQCADGALRVYQAAGRCELASGTCAYDSADTRCDHGCLDDSRCVRAGDVLWSTTRFGRGALERLSEDREHRLYLLSGQRVVAMGDDGSRLWEREVLRRENSAIVVGTHSQLYLRDWDALLSLRGSDGTGIWQAPLDDPLETAWRNQAEDIALDSAAQTIYVARHATLYAISTTGQRRWRYDARPNGGGQPWPMSGPWIDLDGNLLLVARAVEHRGGLPVLTACELHKLSPAGALLWSASPVSAADGCPLIEALGPKGLIYLRIQDRLAAYRDSAAGPVLRWSASILGDTSSVSGAVSSVSVATDGNVWFYLHDGAAGKISELDGQGQVVRTIDDMPLLAAPRLFLTTNHTLVLVGALFRSPEPVGAPAATTRLQQLVLGVGRDGQRLWDLDLLRPIEDPTASQISGVLVSASGMIYALSNHLGLVAIQGDQPLEQIPWAADMADNQRTNRLHLP